MAKKPTNDGFKNIQIQETTDQQITTKGCVKDGWLDQKERLNDNMTRLDWDARKAANAGISYGKMKAAEAPPITVEIPKNLKKVARKIKKPVSLEPMTVATLVELLNKIAAIFPDAEVKAVVSHDTSGFQVSVVFQSNGVMWETPTVVLQG